jgi:hypothetical protein
MKHAALIAVVVALGLTTAAMVRADSRQASPAAAAAVRRGCPTIGPGNARSVAVDQVIVTARRVVTDHRSEEVQGRRYRLNNKTTPVLEAVMLGGLPPLPGNRPLARMAKHRCPHTNVAYTWAVVFGDTISVVCCLRATVFVAATKSAWFVF